ncbi:histidine phosphatase family protein [Neobacillus sp. Marseille-QA0830]
MLTIYITRHGETQWNKEGRLQGWGDSELTEKGLENAIRLGERLSATPIDVIYTSPSGRAVQTSKLVRGDRDIPIAYEHDFKEINLGDWEGKQQDEIVQDHEQEYTHFWNAPHLYDHRPHNGEGLADFKQRVELALKKLTVDHEDGSILIVAHAGVIKALFSTIMGIPTERFWDDPFIHGTSLTVVHWNGEKFDVELVGDTGHINGAPKQK